MRANRRVSGPVLQSVFLVVLAHSVLEACLNISYIPQSSSSLPSSPGGFFSHYVDELDGPADQGQRLGGGRIVASFVREERVIFDLEVSRFPNGRRRVD